MDLNGRCAGCGRPPEPAGPGSVTDVTTATEAAIGQILDAAAPHLADTPTGRRRLSKVLHAHADLLHPDTDIDRTRQALWTVDRAATPGEVQP